MRVRIKKHPFEEGFWGVQVKHWWSGWVHKDYFCGDNAQERALAAAKEIINPTITEVYK